MTIEKCKDFVKDGYGTWDDTSKPTTFANMHDFMKNQNNVTLALANGLWQPSTAYVVDAIVHSPSLPAGCKATCTKAGTTGSTEPKWTAYGTTVTDGTCKWKVETDVQSTLMAEVTNAINQKMASLSTIAPTGVVQAFAGRTTPQGWLLCDGSAVDRTLYAALFNVIGTTYGAGDGSTTFNLPNLIDKFVEGSATAGTVKSAGLPNINGSITFRTVDLTDNNLIFDGDSNAFHPTGTFYKTTQSWSGSHGSLYTSEHSPYKPEQLNMDASRSSSVYGKSTTVQPPALTMRYIIKY